MGDFLDIAFSMPTVIFTISSLVLLGFWVVTTVIGAGVDGLDGLDFDLDVDPEVEVPNPADAGTASTTGTADAAASANAAVADAGGVFRSALSLLAIGPLPPLIALNLESLLAWLTSMVLMAIIGGRSGFAAALIAVAVFVAALTVGTFLTRAFGRRFAYVFTPTHAMRRREFVGTVCTITTARVDAGFGQAEVRDPEGGSLVVQVRCAKPNDLGVGDRALIFDLDSESGHFSISPDRSLAG